MLFLFLGEVAKVSWSDSCSSTDGDQRQGNPVEVSVPSGSLSVLCQC